MVLKIGDKMNHGIWQSKTGEKEQVRELDEVWLVGHHGPEHNTVLHVCGKRETAEQRFEELRLELLNRAKESLKLSKGNEWGSEDMYERIIENLSEKDPEKIDNFPQNTPYIEKMVVV